MQFNLGVNDNKVISITDYNIGFGSEEECIAFINSKEREPGVEIGDHVMNQATLYFQQFINISEARVTARPAPIKDENSY